MTNVLTIREAVKRAKADEMPVSEYALRQWIRTGEIPCRMAGSKALIFYPNLVEYLKGGDNASATTGVPRTRM